MKAIAIAQKDILRSVRSAFFLAFGLGLPLLTTVIFYFAFGGMADDGASELPHMEVYIVNQDKPGSLAGDVAFGQMLVDALASQDLQELFSVVEGADPEGARQTVDAQEVDVAIIVPPDLTRAVLSQEGVAHIELYADPTQTVGPDVVRAVLQQFIDGYAGVRIATDVVASQLTAEGIDVDPASMEVIARAYGDWLTAAGERDEGHRTRWLDVRAPAGEVEQGAGLRTQVLELIMSGMMVFYVFFTGAVSAQNILQEEEDGTLPRLFTTPTSISALLGGKLLAAATLLTVQVLVLVLLSGLVFQLGWGDPLPVALATVALVAVASGFGLCITSFLHSTRQAGAVYGGVMTVMGMLGISSVFTAGVPDTASAAQTARVAALVTPQGWAVRAWHLAMEGAPFASLALTVLITLGLAMVFYVVGILRFRKRFA